MWEDSLLEGAAGVELLLGDAVGEGFTTRGRCGGRSHHQGALSAEDSPPGGAVGPFSSFETGTAAFAPRGPHSQPTLIPFPPPPG